jgi:hypothetical protein
VAAHHCLIGLRRFETTWCSRLQRAPVTQGRRNTPRRREKITAPLRKPINLKIFIMFMSVPAASFKQRVFFVYRFFVNSEVAQDKST